MGAADPSPIILARLGVQFGSSQQKQDESGYDQNGWVKTNHYQGRPWSELIELWRAYNLHLHHVMSNADKAKLNTPCSLHTLQEIAFKTVPKSEPVTLEYLMKDYVDHLKHHLAQVFGDQD